MMHINCIYKFHNKGMVFTNSAYRPPGVKTQILMVKFCYSNFFLKTAVCGVFFWQAETSPISLSTETIGLVKFQPTMSSHFGFRVFQNFRPPHFFVYILYVLSVCVCIRQSVLFTFSIMTEWLSKGPSKQLLNCRHS